MCVLFVKGELYTKIDYSLLISGREIWKPLANTNLHF